ncbi:MAG: TonB-dependent receptor [Bacteroidetes bacterium]|nr:TonB-dependent receptor [Bacteroidota bacterium]
MYRLLWFMLFCIPQQLAAQDDQADTSVISKKDSAFIENLKDLTQDRIPVLSLDDGESDDAANQDISSLLTAGRNPFLNAASFNFSVARFKLRGYDGDLSSTYMNGIPMQNLDNGSTPYNLWSGLNDVLRNREMAYGIQYLSFGYGSIGSISNIDTRALKQRVQTSFSYALSNRNYTHRWMLTHSSGMNRKGWAFSFSASRRWANEGYVPGTYYNGWSIYLGIDKKFNSRQILSLVAFYTPVENGRQGAATSEMQMLAGTHYYNPYWGYQNGEKRNASVGKTNMPLFILSDEYKINENTTLTSALSYTFGKRAISGIDWFNAPDPRPDYYKYLPSYQQDSMQSALVAQRFYNDPSLCQINWQRFYDVNRSNFQTVNNIDGIPTNTISGNRSLYILQDRVTQTNKYNFSITLNTRMNNHAFLTSGFHYQWQRNHYYQELIDLLGGDFYIDLNQFAEQDFPNDPNAIQNDLNHPNRVIKVGDQYGYNYAITLKKVSSFIEYLYKTSHIDFFGGAEFSQTSFYRTGYVRNGLFPDHSFGNSTVNLFNNFSIKTGITYKINGRNYFYVNGAYLTRAPYYDNAYISPRSRDFLQDSLRSEIIKTIESGYILNAPSLKIRLGVFYTSIQHGVNVLTFYNDDYSNFVNYAVRDINREMMGIEFGLDAKILRNISLTGAASVGSYYYTSRQNATIILDNSASILANETVYSENYRIAGTPQQAFSAGMSYRSPKYWFLNLTANYFNEMWLDFNPIRRTYNAIEGVDPKSDLWNDILAQQKLSPQYTLDFFGGYSFRLKKFMHQPKPAYIVFLIGISNLLNNTDFQSGGYEQLRFDFASHDVNKFPPKYYYAYGLNYFISLTLRF